jgi:hypothetical protein
MRWWRYDIETGSLRESESGMYLHKWDFEKVVASHAAALTCLRERVMELERDAALNVAAREVAELALKINASLNEAQQPEKTTDELIAIGERLNTLWDEHDAKLAAYRQLKETK